MMSFWATRTGRRFGGTRAVFERWNDLPYGKWTCVDGREVLFNRCYEPIWQRKPGGDPAPADPTEWIHWQRQEWFYRDDHSERQSWECAQTALNGWFADVG